MGDPTLKELLKRAVELVMPNMRSYYRMTRKGRVVKSYDCAGSYWADVQPLRNDDSDDADEPVVTRVEIPVIWGGSGRGVVCPPAVGTLCDISYYDGDPNYPRISNFRWAKGLPPECALGAFVIQQGPGVYLRITAGGDIEHATGTDWNIEVGGTATITAPQVTIVGATGVTLTTPLLTVSGNIQAGGDILDAGGAKSMAGMRTAYNGHHHAEHGTGGGTTGTPDGGM